MQIKLLILSSSFPNNKGKYKGNFIFELAKHLSDMNIDPIIVCPHIFNSLFIDRCKNILILRYPYFFPFSLQKIADGNGIVNNVQKIAIARIQIPFLIFFEIAFSFYCTLKYRINCIHSHWIVPQGLIGAIISLIFNKRHICTIHAADIFLLKKIPFNRLILKFIIKNTSHFFVVSKYVYETTCEMLSECERKIFQKKTTIMPMGVNCNQYNIINPINELKKYNFDDKFILLYIGRLTDKKGVEFLIDSMKEIVSCNPNVHLLICGTGPNKEYLQDRVNINNLDDYITFRGFISEQEKGILLKRADILIVPSIKLDSGETEGMPVVILEGMAVGLPIIASNVSGIPDVIKNGCNGILVFEKDAHSIAQSVIMLMRNPLMRINLAKEAKKTSENYDWKKISQYYFVKMTERGFNEV